MTELQGHLANLTETYWELVRARSEYLQRQKLLANAETILNRLKGRAEVDALDRQVYRASAAVSKRRAEIARSLASIKNAESRIRLLVNEPMLLNSAALEFTPVDLPDLAKLPLNLQDAVATAIAHRQDISSAIRAVTAAKIRNGVATNDLWPRLDLLIGTYVAGLDGDSDALNSWVNQFKDGRPGFNVGFEFEIPVGNRAAQARKQQRQWELTRAMHEFKATVETGITEVEISVREVQTAYSEMTGRYHSMVAAENETEFLVDRWLTLPGVDDSVTLLLEDLLDSQERLADEEAAFSKALFDYAVATVRLKQAMGILFKVG
ncbi:MAG: TolC family protein [Planctomycetota bacterium]